MNAWSFQLFGGLTSRVDSHERRVALTLDDGPTEGDVQPILTALAARGVRATFYVNGSDCRAALGSCRALVAAGHELGNHGYDHRALVFVTPAMVADQVQRTDEQIRAAGHRGDITFRPPYGKKLLILPWWLREHDRRTVTWDVAVEQWSGPATEQSAEQIADATVAGVRPGSIVLLHPWNGRRATQQAIPRIVDRLTAQGYRFVTVSECWRPGRTDVQHGPDDATPGGVMRIGFIGLGIMGAPMATNLAAAGHELLVLERHAAAARSIDGAQIRATPADIAREVDVVITMLPDSPQVRQVALGEGGLAEGAWEGLRLVDMSSISPVVAREVAEALAARGVAMLDAPVSGGEPKAIDGTLAVMVGGDRAVYDDLAGLFEPMADVVTYVGPIGAGNVAKLANQVIVAVNIAAVGEALTLAQRAGVDPAAVVDAIAGGLAGSAVLNAKAPMMLAGNDTPGFRLALHAKDLDNALSAAHASSAPVPLAAAVREMMTALTAAGKGDADHSGLVQYYERLTGEPVRRGSR